MIRTSLGTLVAAALLAQPALAETGSRGPLVVVASPSPFVMAPAYGVPAERKDPSIGPGAAALPKALYYISGLTAAVVFYLAGSDMSSIKSVSGNSTSEAFYQGMGKASYGLSLLSLSFVAQQMIRDLTPPQEERQ